MANGEEKQEQRQALPKRVSLKEDDGDGDGILNGGAGIDTLDGGPGNDIYIFGRGSGLDIIVDPDTTAGEADVLSLDEGVLP